MGGTHNRSNPYIHSTTVLRDISVQILSVLGGSFNTASFPHSKSTEESKPTLYYLAYNPCCFQSLAFMRW